MVWYHKFPNLLQCCDLWRHPKVISLPKYLWCLSVYGTQRPPYAGANSIFPTYLHKRGKTPIRSSPWYYENTGGQKNGYGGDTLKRWVPTFTAADFEYTFATQIYKFINFLKFYVIRMHFSLFSLRGETSTIRLFRNITDTIWLCQSGTGNTFIGRHLSVVIIFKYRRFLGVW